MFEDLPPCSRVLHMVSFRYLCEGSCCLTYQSTRRDFRPALLVSKCISQSHVASQVLKVILELHNRLLRCCSNAPSIGWRYHRNAASLVSRLRSNSRSSPYEKLASNCGRVRVAPTPAGVQYSFGCASWSVCMIVQRAEDQRRVNGLAARPTNSETRRSHDAVCQSWWSDTALV